MKLRALPGTYAMWFRCESTATVTVGRRGRLGLVPGHYIYIGSAFGPGGIKARVARHCRQRKPKRWHIDYIRPYLTPLGVWYSHSPEHLEHVWANALADTLGSVPIDGFGCSDCRCRAHLFWSEHAPDLVKILAQVLVPANATFADLHCPGSEST